MLGPRTCLGIDAAGRDIKIVELRQSGSTYEVVQAARIDVTHGDAGSALRDYLVDTQTRASSIVFALPMSACSVKFAQFPKAKEQDLAKMVRYEAGAQIPLPLNDVIWDYTAKLIADQHHVAIAGARRTSIENLLSVADAAQVRPHAVIVSALASAKSATADERPRSGPVLVVDIGTEWTDICLVDGEMVSVCRSIDLGSDGLIAAFASDLGIGLDEAEQTKRTRGIGLHAASSAHDSSVTTDTGDTLAAAPPPFDDASHEARSQVERWVEAMAIEIRRSVISIGSSDGRKRPTQAILVGGSATVPGLCESLSGRTWLQMEVGDPWARMRVSSVAAHTAPEPHAAFAVATGLAMAGLDGRDAINLMPRNRAEKQIRRRKEVGLIAGLGMTALVLLILLIAGGPSVRARAGELADLRTDARQVRRDVRATHPDVRTTALAVEETVKNSTRNDRSPIELLRLLSLSMPRSVWLSEFTFDSGKSLTLKGRALSNSSVADAVDSITGLALFDTVGLDYSNLAEGEAVPKYDFQITCALKSKKRPSGRPSRVDGSARTGIVVQ